MKTAAIIVSISEKTEESKISASTKLGTISAIQRIIVTIQKAGINDIYLVTNNSNIKKEVAKFGTTILNVDMDEQKDMFGYIKKAISFLGDNFDQAIILPDSIALFNSKTVKSLCSSSKDVAIPVYNDTNGHPIKIKKKILKRILNDKKSQSLRDVIKNFKMTIEKIDVEDKGIIVKQTDHFEYNEALNLHDLNKFRPDIKVRVAREKLFLGPGIKHLLLSVEKTGSLSVACDLSGISYSKGRNMIGTVEEQLGSPVLERQQGGEHGGSSTLTDVGKQVLLSYIQYENAVKKYAQEQFNKYFNF